MDEEQKPLTFENKLLKLFEMQQQMHKQNLILELSILIVCILLFVMMVVIVVLG